MGHDQAAFLQYREFDEMKLKEMALRRFASAWRTGRTIAFVGSGVTAHLGYGSWDNLFTKYLDQTIKLLKGINLEQDASTKQIINDIIKSHKKKLTVGQFDKRTLASIAEDVMRYVDGLSENNDSDLYQKLEKAGASFFHLAKSNGEALVVKAVLQKLGIERILTTNYDLEFERELMLWGKAELLEPDKFLGIEKGSLHPEYPIIIDQRTHKLSRILPGGQSIVSDVFQRERTDRLIEFAVGSPDYEAQIFHLHGRADKPHSMVISLRDYDRLYRQSGITKLPFEHALKILFAGNPIICIGLGMSEDEINQTLQEFIADHPRKNFAQIFILSSEKDVKKRQLQRFNWKHKLGAYGLFVEDFVTEPVSDTQKDPVSLALLAVDKIKELVTNPKSETPDKSQVKQFQTALSQIQAISVRDAYQHKEFLSQCELKIRDKKIGNDRAKSLADQVQLLSQEAIRKLELYPKKSTKEKHFRSLSSKLSSSKDDDSLNLWKIIEEDSSHENKHEDIIPNCLDEIISNKNQSTLHVLYAPPGTGKGTIASQIVSKFKDNGSLNESRKAMLINCNFAFDVDAMLSGLSGLISKAPADAASEARAKIWKGLTDNFVFWEAEEQIEALVVFNDFDRFFDRSGLPLSNEIDILCRAIVSRLATDKEAGKKDRADVEGVPDNAPKQVAFHWVFLGTERVYRYFKMIDRENRNLTSKIEKSDPDYKWKPHFTEYEIPSSTTYKYTEILKEKFGVYPLTGFQEGLIDHHKQREAPDRRRAFMAAYLTPEALRQVKEDIDAVLCLDILTVMAFIGQTVERSVLAYAPRIRKQKYTAGFIKKDAEVKFHIRIEVALTHLHGLGLVHEIENFKNDDNQSNTLPDNKRYGLHRSVLAELRDRFGVPLGEAKLATAFNLSLYAAQPLDSYNPETDIHDELGKLVDYMVGAYKDEWRVPPTQEQKENNAFLRTQPHISSCLRTALGVLRSYYSTAALVTYDTTGRAGDDDEDRPGPLTEHCERLERVIWATEETLRARETKKYKAAKKRYTPPPYYPDDLVWLHNERGVAKLMQGDLYEARASFDEASRLNNEFVEFDYRGPNWVRLNLNQLAVDFERGRLSQARSRIDTIITAIGGHDTLHGITSHYGKETKPGEEGTKLRTVVSKDYTHDELLTVGLTTGYRALIDFMGGRLETSRRRFISAINILREINEQRAYAMFSLHYASLLNCLREREHAIVRTETAIAALQSSQQRDVASLGQIKEVWLQQCNQDGLPQKEHLRHLNAILEYSASSDMHRVRVEARATLAKLKIQSGDYDTALEHAADAMALAARFGMSLRKIALRTLIGRILIKRGDQHSGHALIDQAIKEADRIGYQRAVEAAQDVRIIEGRLIDFQDY